MLRLSVPPATTTESMPALMPLAAIATADRPAAQCRLSASPGTSVSPRRTAVWRRDHAAALQGLGEHDVVDVGGGDAAAPIAAPTATSASSKASTPMREPLRARPIGVRAQKR